MVTRLRTGDGHFQPEQCGKHDHHFPHGEHHARQRLAGLLGVIASPWAGGGDAFGRVELWVYAIIAGVVFRAPGTWLGFWTINRSGVQTYLIALTAMPFFAIVLEAAAAQLGWLSPPNLSKGEWLSAAVILGGAVWLIAARLRTPTS